MKKSTCFFLLFVLVFAAAAADAQTQAKFWIGGSGTLLMFNGTGTAGSGSDEIDFDISSSFMDYVMYEEFEGYFPGYEDSPADFGLNWDNKMLYGLKPEIGVKFNDQFAVSAAYAIYFKKSSSEGFSENISETDPVTLEEFDFTLDMTVDFEWSMKSLQLLLHFYPSVENPGLYLLAGVDMVSMDLEAEVVRSLEGSYYDPIADETYPIDESESETEKGDGSATGLMFGLGYEFSPQEKMTFFGSATYSLAKYTEDDFLDEELEFKVGGFAANLGVKFYLGAN